MSLSNFCENLLLGWLFKNLTYWPPHITVDLSLSPPTERGGVDPPTHESYTPVLTETETWELTAPGVIVNKEAIKFPLATGDWGTITHLALSDKEYYNMMLAFGALVPAIDVLAGQRAILTVGTLVTMFDLE